MTHEIKRRLYLNPYKIILRKKIIDGFAAFSEGNFEPLLALYANNVRQSFAGEHALGGERHDKAKVKQWFERFVRLLPSKFTIHDVYVLGWPWDTVAVVKFEDHVTPNGVEPYTNYGAMVARISWGKATDVQIYVDTEKIVRAFDQLEASGVAEAGAEPIG